MTTKVQYTTERLDHLGVVVGMCDEIQLVETINRLVQAPRRQVTVRQAVKAMVLNALVFVNRPLYLTPEFFSNKPVEMLIGPGITPQMLNDDSLGRALDALFEAGLTEIFAQVSSHALRVMGIEHRFVHLDISSFHLHGNYDRPEEPEVIRILRGYSRDGRPDLKQVVVALLTTYRAALPVWIQAMDGNTADAKALPNLVKAYVQQLEQGNMPYFVADSSLYSEDNLQDLSEVKWITRVPNRVGLAQKLRECIQVERMQESQLSGYRYLEVGVAYGGVRQRWLVVHSQQAEEREKSALTARINKERSRADKALQALKQKTFLTQEAAHEAVAGLAKGWRYHRARYRVTAVAHYDRPGRPGRGTQPAQLSWRISDGHLEEDSSAIAWERERCGKFVLATNELDAYSLSAEQILAAYKGQAVGPERGFRFLKDPLFFADSLFLKLPQRIMGLIMVMGLALLVYALAEHKLRQTLQQKQETLPNQVGKPTQHPTMRRVFQIFEGVDVLVIQHPHQVERIVTNLTPLRQRIAHLLGPYVEKYYFAPR